jgi:tetratricopeptide (TPR) repeat protein
MVEPPRRTGAYARAYQQALVRLGVSHINLGEWAGALNALEEAVSFDSPGFNAYLTLAQAQCEVGRSDDGRRSLDQIEGMANSIPGQERPVVLALVAYQRAVCSQGDFERAESALQRVQTGSLTIQAFEAFIEQGEALNPHPARLQQAVGNVRRRIAKIRDRMRRGDETYS